MEQHATSAWGLAAFFTFGMCCCGGCEIFFCGGKFTFLALLAGCQRIGVLAFSGLLIAQFNTIQAVTNKNLEILENVDEMDCSDQWSIIDTKIAIEQQKESSSSLLKSYVLLSVNFLLLFFEICFLLCIVTKARGLQFGGDQHFKDQFGDFIQYYLLFN